MYVNILKEEMSREYREYQFCGLRPNTDHAGLEISVNSDIALPFSRQIAIGNAGPV